MQWKRYAALGILLCIALAGVIVVVAFTAANKETTGAVVDLRGQSVVHVVLTPAGYQPEAIRITQGTTVVFSTTRNDEFWPASDPHPTHTDYPEFDPKQPVAPKASWSFTFMRVGRWGYHDHIRSYFTGTIYVDAQA